MFKTMFWCVFLFICDPLFAEFSDTFEFMQPELYVKRDLSIQFVSDWKNKTKTEKPQAVNVDILIKDILKESNWLVHLTHYKRIHVQPFVNPLIIRSLTPVIQNQIMEGHLQDFITNA